MSRCLIFRFASAAAAAVCFFSESCPAGTPAPRSQPAADGSKNDLPTLALQARAFVITVDYRLKLMEKHFPSLGDAISSTKASWTSSPFAGGARAIEADMIAQAGQKTAKAFLTDADRKCYKILDGLMVENRATEADALEDLKQINSWSKGGIESPIVRGTLLAWYPPYRAQPEKEYDDGYMVPVESPVQDGFVWSIRIPMSWAGMGLPEKKLLGYRTGYGMGQTTFVMAVSAAKDSDGDPVPALTLFAQQSEVAYRDSLREQGENVLSFRRIQVNGMPAVLYSYMLSEGQHRKISWHTVRVYKGMQVVEMSLVSGANDEDLASRQAEVSLKLFDRVTASLDRREKKGIEVER